MHHKSLPPTPSARVVAVEACVQTAGSAAAAARAGVDRIELCAALEQGGVTPGAGLLREVRRLVGIAVHVMIRTRTGDFCYTAADLEAMLHDVREARRAGADGIVIGALDPSGAVDRVSCARLVEAAGPLSVTFHRAFDCLIDQRDGLETLIGLGVARVLTAGGAASALEGVPQLTRLVEQADGRITILAGGGVRAAGVRRLVDETGAREIHLGPRAGPRGDLDLNELNAVLAVLGRPSPGRN